MDRKHLLRRSPWPQSQSRPVVSPIQPSVVYASEDASGLDQQYEEGSGFTYAREGHPNARLLAQKLDALEGGAGGVVTGSGMAAVGALFLACVKAGDHVIGGDQLYGRSLRMLTEDLPRMGVETSLVDPTDAHAVAAALRPNTRVILVETVANPMLRVADIPGIAAVKGQALLAVDNTFSTPLGFRPFDHGADVVIHSVTKLLAGHSDATLGYITAQDTALTEAFDVACATWGTTASPFDCWLAERGLMTFALRYAQAEATAVAVADALAGIDVVEQVLHPARTDHPDHNRAAGMLLAQGGNMVTFRLPGGRAEADAFIRAAGGIAFAPTLGDVGSTLSHPASSSHRKLSAEARAALGIQEGTFRLSVGLEPPEVLIEELTHAIRHACQ